MGRIFSIPAQANGPGTGTGRRRTSQPVRHDMIALLDSIEIGYDEGGTGVAVLFIHGFPHDRSLWTPQLQGLAVHARCLAADLRGFGETTAKPPYSMDRYADDL